MVSAGSRPANGLPMDCMGNQTYQAPQEPFNSNGHMAAVMAAVAALTGGNSVAVDQQQHKQYQLMQIQAAAQQLQNLQSVVMMQQHQQQQQSQQQAAAAAILDAAAAQQQQQQMLYNSRPMVPLARMALAPPTQASALPPPLMAVPGPLPPAPSPGMLPYMSLTNADYEDGDQSTDESEELDDAKSRCAPRNGGAAGGSGRRGSQGPSPPPAGGEKETSPPAVERPGSGGTASVAAALPVDLKMIVDVVSENEKGCQVWMDYIARPEPPLLRGAREMPAVVRKRKANFDVAAAGAAGQGGSNGSSSGGSGGSGGSDTMVEQNGNAGKRMRLLWTPELHGRFLHAVNQLGVSSAVPKTILQMMNVGGMTRENVASHLQKYRLYLKRLAGLPASAPLRTTDTLRQLQTAQQVAAAAGGTRLDAGAGVTNAVLTTAELISQLEAMNARGHGHTARVNNAAAAALAASLLPPVAAVRPPPPPSALNLMCPPALSHPPLSHPPLPHPLPEMVSPFISPGFTPPGVVPLVRGMGQMAGPFDGGAMGSGGSPVNSLRHSYSAITAGVNSVSLSGGTSRGGPVRMV